MARTWIVQVRGLSSVSGTCCFRQLLREGSWRGIAVAPKLPFVDELNIIISQMYTRQSGCGSCLRAGRREKDVGRVDGRVAMASPRGPVECARPELAL